MAGASAEANAGTDPEANPEANAEAATAREPERPSQLSKRSWWRVLKGTVREFHEDNLTDWAAALTYYAVQAVFPALLVLVAAVGLLDKKLVQPLVENLTALAPGPVKEIVTQALGDLQRAPRAAGILALVGLAAAIWGASGYVGAFIRAANAIYDVPEGRPLWKLVPLRLGVTLLTGALLSISLLAVLFTGRLAEWLGALVGLGPQAATVWDIAKWPVLVVIIGLTLAILYWASPNARPSGFRWISPGGLLAVAAWVAVSAGFAVYVANFGTYNKTYGTLGGVIVFLIWLYLTNIAVLLGAEFDAELERGKAIAGGHPPEKEPFIELRDTRALEKDRE